MSMASSCSNKKMTDLFSLVTEKTENCGRSIGHSFQLTYRRSSMMEAALLTKWDKGTFALNSFTMTGGAIKWENYWAAGNLKIQRVTSQFCSRAKTAGKHEVVRTHSGRVVNSSNSWVWIHVRRGPFSVQTCMYIWGIFHVQKHWRVCCYCS